jgi:hypothetical protein
VAFRVCAIVFAVAVGLGFFGLPSLVTGWFEGGERVIHRVHDLGYGDWAGILLTVPLVALTRTPERRPAAVQQVVVAVAAYWLAILVAVDFEPIQLMFMAVFGAIAAVLVWLYPAPRAGLASTGRPSFLLGLIAVVAAIPLVAYALEIASFQRKGVSSDPHVMEHHWTTMAALALGILLVAGLASLRAPGWRVAGWSAGLAAGVLGLASIIFSGYAGSLGTGWGSVALGGGLAFIAATEWEARRTTVPAR